VASLCVIPMQDVLGLDSTHRMNAPGLGEGSWEWRFNWQQVDDRTPDALPNWRGYTGDGELECSSTTFFSCRPHRNACRYHPPESRVPRTF
jgi:hypothetical protein